MQISCHALKICSDVYQWVILRNGYGTIIVNKYSNDVTTVMVLYFNTYLICCNKLNFIAVFICLAYTECSAMLNII